jgi:hypothetical protein
MYERSSLCLFPTVPISASLPVSSPVLFVSSFCLSFSVALLFLLSVSLTCSSILLENLFVAQVVQQPSSSNRERACVSRFTN